MTGDFIMELISTFYPVKKNMQEELAESLAMFTSGRNVIESIQRRHPKTDELTNDNIPSGEDSEGV